jgi:glucose/mannose-6-phosphate isomerase
METNTIDKYNLRQAILDFPKQFEEGFALAKNIKIPDDLKSVCVSGMGGSNFPTDALEGYLKNIFQTVPIFKNRGYALPAEARDRCLNIISSYSGNTEEPLASLDEAIESDLPIVGIGNGGKLIEICRSKNIPYVVIPEMPQPRYATGYFFSTILQIMINAGLVKDVTAEILNFVERLKELALNLESDGRELAHKLAGRTPIIHTAENLKAVGRIWKIKINETAKTPCFFNYYPELNHNEMVGYTLPQGKFHIITVMDNKAHPQIIKRMRITPGLLSKYGIESSVLDIPDNSNDFLAIFSTLALADWVSYYLALEYKVDPTPVDMVEDFKKLL